MTVGHSATRSEEPVGDTNRAYQAVWEAEGAGLPLATLLTQLGTDHLGVFSAPHGLDRRAHAAVIWEGVGAVDIEPGDLVLAVGVTGAAELSHVLAVAARTGAAAVITKQPEHPDWLRAEAQLREVTVLCMPVELGWHQLHNALSATLATSPSSTPSRFGVLDGDLFALADAAAASLGGPVEIDDAAMRPLAYSNNDHEVDELRRTSILTRHPPADYMDWLRRSGLLQQVRAAQWPVRIEAGTSRPRLAMPIRAGADLLGYLWLAEGSVPIEDADPWVLVDAARVASGLMMRLSTLNTERRLPSDLLRRALDGAGCADVLSGTFPSGSGNRFQLVGFRMPSGSSAPREQRPMLLQNLVALRAESAGYTAITTTLGELVYLLLGGGPSNDSPSRVESLAHSVVALATRQLHTTLVAAVGHPLPDLSTLHAARLEVDRLTAMISKTGPTVGTAEGLRPRAVLAELRELVSDRPHLLSGPIEKLRKLDETKGTEYLTTLRAYFDAQSDLSEAAKRLCVHRNTVRYRIGRLQELCNTDLLCPVERLVLELQLKLTTET